jgi:hypothetical protein
MKGPKHERDYEDRGLDCQFDLEPEFVALVDTAISAGWPHVEALNGLFELARSHLIMCQALDEEQRKILAKMKELEANGAGRRAHH